MKIKNMIGLAGIYSVIAIFAVIYQLLAYFQTGKVIYPYVLPWTVFLCGLYMADVMLLKKGITIERFLYVNIFAGIVYILLEIVNFSNITGVLPRIFAALIIGITIGMAEESARAEVKTNQLLLQLEISLVVLGIVLFFEDAKIMPVSYGRVYMVLAVVFDLCALVLSRTMVSKEGVKKNNNMVRGVIMLGGVASVLFGTATVFVASCTEVGRPLLESFISVCLRAFLDVVTWVNHMTIRFINMLPGYQSKGGTIWVEPVDVPSQQGQRYDVEFNIQLLLSMILTIAFLVFLIFVVRYILKKFSSLHLKQEMLKKEDESSIQRKRTSLLQYGKNLAKRLLKDVRLEWNMIRNPDSPETWILKAEKLGRKYHVPKKTFESPGGYLRRLAEDEKMIEKGMKELLLERAEKIDLYFYGK